MPTVAEFATNWRASTLPALRKGNGRPLSAKTRADYARMLAHHVETHTVFRDTEIGLVTVRDVRAFLARWMASPAYYNYMKAVLSRMFAQAVDEGLLDGNPVSGVVRRPVARRETILPLDHYLDITNRLEDWEARACDLIYLVSHRPADVLRLRDEWPWIRYEGDKVVVSFTATKNEQAVEISENLATEGGIGSTLAWFRRWKRMQGINSPWIVCYPATARPRDIGRAVSRDYLSRKFADAVVEAGFDRSAYTLRDLRKTALTAEALLAGEATRKGGHKTEQMRQYYVVGGVPQRVSNNLVVARP